MITSMEIDKISAAFVKAQAIMTDPKKDGFNPGFKNKFATLGATLDVVKDALNTNELAVLQSVGFENGLPTVTTRVIHSSGQWFESDAASTPLSKQDAQGVGSAISYLKRYSLQSIFGITADDDDDGNKASGKSVSAAPAADANLAIGATKIADMTPEQVSNYIPSVTAALADPAKAGNRLRNQAILVALESRKKELV